MVKVVKWAGVVDFWFLRPHEEMVEEYEELKAEYAALAEVDESGEYENNLELIEVPQELLDNYNFGMLVVREVFNELIQMKERASNE